MIPAHGRRSRWISELEANLVYKSSSRIAKATKKNPLWEGREGRGGEGSTKVPESGAAFNLSKSLLSQHLQKTLSFVPKL